MSDLLSYELAVNGETLPVRGRAGATLLDVLRVELGLTGAKRGCNQGVCGACTVLVDGQPIRSCLTVAANVGERPVTTIEGLTRGRSLTPLQQALLNNGAIQCGFCTPGIVLTLEAFLRDQPRPSAEDVRHALSGNLCRCSGYVKIVEAAVSVTGSAP